MNMERFLCQHCKTGSLNERPPCVCLVLPAVLQHVHLGLDGSCTILWGFGEVADL